MNTGGIARFIRDVVIGVVLLSPVAWYFSQHVFEPRSSLDAWVVNDFAPTRVRVRDPRSGACAAYVIDARQESSSADHTCPAL